MLLSKMSYSNLMSLQALADKENKLIEMRDKVGILLAVGTSIKALNEEKTKEGKFIYRVDSHTSLNYHTLNEIITYDIQLNLYEGKKINSYKNEKTQIFFNKQEEYWYLMFRRWQNNHQNNILLGIDYIINKIKI